MGWYTICWCMGSLSWTCLTSSGAHPGDAGRAAERLHSPQFGGDSEGGGRGNRTSRRSLWFYRHTDCCAWCVRHGTRWFCSIFLLMQYRFYKMYRVCLKLMGLSLLYGKRKKKTKGNPFAHMYIVYYFQSFWNISSHLSRHASRNQQQGDGEGGLWGWWHSGTEGFGCQRTLLQTGLPG